MKIFSKIKTLWSKIVNSGKVEVTQEEVNIETWRLTYQGKSDWLDRVFIGLDGNSHKRVLASINPLKFLSQKMTTLIYSEVPELVTKNKKLEELLEKENFWIKQHEMIEQQLALGAQALKMYKEDGEIKIDYVTANHFVLISWDNRIVTEAAFLDYQTIKGKPYVRVETHLKHYAQMPLINKETGEQETTKEGVPIFIDGPQDGYTIRNDVYKLTDNDVKKEDLAGVMPQYESETFLKVLNPPFVIIKNPIANNMDTQTPIGLSIGANSMDTFKALDVAYDSLSISPELCCPRIVVSDELVRTKFDSEGNKVKYFDPTDMVYQTAPLTDVEDVPIKDMTIPLVVDPLKAAIQIHLNILCMQIGLSPGFLTFDSATGAVTATQIISEDSDTYKTRQRYVNALTTGYLQFFDALQELMSLEGQAVPSDVNLVWDDSIIQDKDAEFTRWTALYNAGGCELWEYLLEVNPNVGDEEQAKAKATEIQKNRAKTIDFTGE